MQLKLILPAIAVVALGASIGAMQGEGIADLPMPALPGAGVLDNVASAASLLNSEYATELPDGYSLMSVKQDPFYGETTLFYATPEIRKTVTNDDSGQDLVGKGVIILDYERIANLEAGTSNHTPLFMTGNSNPVYADSGLNGEYLTIAYFDEGVRLSVYGNGSVDLRSLIKSLDL